MYLLASFLSSRDTALPQWCALVLEARCHSDVTTLHLPWTLLCVLFFPALSNRHNMALFILHAARLSLGSCVFYFTNNSKALWLFSLLFANGSSGFQLSLQIPRLAGEKFSRSKQYDRPILFRATWRHGGCWHLHGEQKLFSHATGVDVTRPGGQISQTLIPQTYAYLLPPDTCHN